MDAKKLEKFVGKDWVNMLLPFFNSKEWLEIEKTIRELKKEGHVLTPLPENWFRVFQMCPYYSLHTIILTDKQYDYIDVYYNHVADGIAFSAKDAYYCPAALTNILYGVEDSQNTENVLLNAKSYDLSPWVKQGILMLNCEVTTSLRMSDLSITFDHYNMWKPFVEYVLEKCLRWKCNLTVGFIGDKCVEHKDWLDIGDFNIISAPLPSFKQTGRTCWEHNDFFKKIKEHQKTQNIEVDYKL